MSTCLFSSGLQSFITWAGLALDPKLALMSKSRLSKRAFHPLQVYTVSQPIFNVWPSCINFLQANSLKSKVKRVEILLSHLSSELLIFLKMGEMIMENYISDIFLMDIFFSFQNKPMLTAVIMRRATRRDFWRRPPKVQNRLGRICPPFSGKRSKKE